MTPELGLFLGILVVVVGFGIYLVSLGSDKADKKHAEDQLEDQQESNKAQSAWSARGGVRGSYQRWLSKRKTRDD